MHPMLNIAVRAARKAGNLIAKNYETPDAVEASQKGSNDFVTNVDKAAEAVIIDTILNLTHSTPSSPKKAVNLKVLIRMFNGLIHGWHYQLYQTSAALRGIYRRSYQRPHRSCCGIRSYA